VRSHTRIYFLVLLAAGAAWVTASLFIVFWDAAPSLRISVFVMVTLVLLIGAGAVARRYIRPLQSLANMLEALREGDYSMRGRNVDPHDALGEVMIEVNSLSSTLHDQRLEALEAGMLLQKVIADVDIALFAFDSDRRLRLVNPAGAELYSQTRDELRGRSARELGLADMLVETSGRIVSHEFPSARGRWEIRRRSIREAGRPLDLLVITDVSRALREEERQAWRRLVRVMGHELNSSLTPIRSMAATLQKLIAREPLPSDWRDDASSALLIIHDRAESLSRFMNAYARLARLPPPTCRETDLGALIRRATSIYAERVVIQSGPSVRASVDADQIEQVLINLVKNAVEATDEGGAVQVDWSVGHGGVSIAIADNGEGLASTENLWVPFFTTKQGGTGLGLVLSREIVENHGGEISLTNRADARGCVARLTLPLSLSAG
jgi:nitrogen fixation/metabolism regulation signal transduction histidine kinase